MDIEGTEVDALFGAEETIRKFKPRLSICTYYRPTDSLVIRDIIKLFNKYYKFLEIKEDEKILYA